MFLLDFPRSEAQAPTVAGAVSACDRSNAWVTTATGQMVAVPYWNASGSPDLEREAAVTGHWGKKTLAVPSGRRRFSQVQGSPRDGLPSLTNGPVCGYRGAGIGSVPAAVPIRGRLETGQEKVDEHADLGRKMTIREVQRVKIPL